MCKLFVFDLIWFGWVLWHINHCRLFNANSSLYVYIKYIGFAFVVFYGISNIVGYSMPNTVYTYIISIYVFFFGLVLWHINYCRLFNAKSCLNILYMICKLSLWIMFLNESELICLHTVK